MVEKIGSDKERRTLGKLCPWISGRSHVFICILVLSSALLFPESLTAQYSGEFEVPINILPDDSRVYTYTNGIDAFWAGESNDYHSSAFHGLTYRKQPIFEDILISVDGKLLDRSNAKAKVTPLSLTRVYPHSGITEQIYFPDRHHILVIELISSKDHDLQIQPAFSSDEVRVSSDSTHLSLIQPAYETAAGLPVQSFMEIAGEGRWNTPPDSTFRYPGSHSGRVYVPREWQGGLDVTDTLRIYFSFAHGYTTHISQRKSWRDGLSGRKQLIGKHLRTPVTDNAEVNKALFWTRFHLNSLIMDQSGKGIYAGLPWFDDYWGRDTFISFPGAVLVNGRYETAREILRSFAKFQIKDSTDVNYGRIPNRVTPGEKGYNTTDGTPWFVWMIHEYLRYTGDFSFAVGMYPVVKRSIEGALKNYVSGEGLLTHGEAETWMDAVGPEGPWSPRGDRAVEIQVLWYKQLQAGVALADLLGRKEDLKRWKSYTENVKKTFRERYWYDGGSRLFDHLNGNGVPDSSHRPNQMFAVSLNEVLSPEQGADVVSSVVEHTVYPWGVASLSPSDPAFHPYHMLPKFYPKDEAYHMGIIWTWLTGSVVTGLTKYGAVSEAYRLTDHLTEHALYRGTPGSIAEVTDALPRDLLPENENASGKIQLSGTFSQAWSLAEYQRNWYQDYFGISPDAFSNTITLFPQLPEDINTVQTMMTMDRTRLHIGYQRTDEEFTFQLRVSGDPAAIQLKLRRNDSIYRLPAPFQLAPTDSMVVIQFDEEKREYRLNDESVPTENRNAKYSRSSLGELRFLNAELPENLAALQEPDHPTLTGAAATADNPEARTAIERSDPADDDLGPAHSYLYPTDPHFESGIFDLTNFAVRYDDKNVYFDLTFRNLVQPGWHPEYGFQLTYVAIGINSGEGGSRAIGRNAQYEVPEEQAPDYTLYIGGGFRLVDSDGDVIVEYIPTEAGYPMADMDSNRIHIAVPKKYLPQPKMWWGYTVLTGGQDDHGGAGLGEFRVVREEPGPWYGGGKSNPDAPNWYDILKIGYE